MAAIEALSGFRITKILLACLICERI